jgi:type VI secretion system protein ImpK
MTARSPETTPTPPMDRLSLLFQDLLTVVARIRVGREKVPQVNGFRIQMSGAVTSAREQARLKGYSEAQATLAAFAVVAFLDEAVLNSSNPVFRDWPRSPLHNELFKEGHVAGETFFAYLRDVLRGDNSQRTADVLEVYQLCLLLGYRGQYGAGNEGNVRAIQDKVAEKIQRIRGPVSSPAAAALPTGDIAPQPADHLTTSLIWVTLALAVMALIMLVVYVSRLDGPIVPGMWQYGARPLA